MALVVEKTTGGRQYKVKDLSQADFGRLEIDLAVVEMPGLMSCRTEFGPSQPFKGAKITGAEVRWCSCNIFSTQDHAASAIARDSASVFPWKRETLEEYWWCTERALDWGPGGGSYLIVDEGGDATLLIHEGVKSEEIYAKTGQLPVPSSTDNTEFQIGLTIIRDGLKTDPMRYHKMKERLDGVSEETTTGVKRLYQMQANGTLLFPAINVNDTFTKSKAGANVVVSDEVDPNQALKAVMRDFSVEKSLYDVVREADISVIPGINCDTMVVLTVKHVKKMEDNNLIYKRELDLNSNFNAGLLKQNFSGRYSNKWVVHEANSSIITLRNTGWPSLMLSWSCTSDGKYEKDYVLAEHLEEKVSALHLPKLTTIEKETLNSDNVSEPKNSDKKGILEMVVRVCSLFGAAALRAIKASKVSINLLGPKVSIDIPLSAIWGN